MNEAAIVVKKAPARAIAAAALVAKSAARDIVDEAAPTIDEVARSNDEAREVDDETRGIDAEARDIDDEVIAFEAAVTRVTAEAARTGDEDATDSAGPVPMRHDPSVRVKAASVTTASDPASIFGEGQQTIPSSRLRVHTKPAGHPLACWHS